MAESGISCLGCLEGFFLWIGVLLSIPLYYLIAIFATRWVFVESAIQFSVDISMFAKCNSTYCNMERKVPLFFMVPIGSFLVILSVGLCMEKYEVINNPSRTIGRNVISMIFSFLYWIFKSQCGCADLEFLSGDSGFFFNMIFMFFVGIGPCLGEYAVDEIIREFTLKYLSYSCMKTMLNFTPTPYLLKCCPLFRPSPNKYIALEARHSVEDEHAV